MPPCCHVSAEAALTQAALAKAAQTQSPLSTVH
jgi:hypothetical protein